MSNPPPRSHTYSPARARLHSPTYLQYQTYLDYLRDEFDFRCAYCLAREIWKDLGDFAVDHWVPESTRPDLSAVYENLVYACDACNEAKMAIDIDLKPLRDNLGDHLFFMPTGEVVGLTNQGKKLVRVLKMWHPDRQRFFRFMIEMGIEALNNSTERKVLGLPARDSLPDLTKKRPRLATADQSYHSMSLRGVLPAIFISQRP